MCNPAMKCSLADALICSPYVWLSEDLILCDSDVSVLYSSNTTVMVEFITEVSFY